jgi:mono/diheme cytochrome c family protein
MPILRISLLLTCVALASVRVSAGEGKPPSAAAIQFFENKIRPLLAQNCFECHGEKKQRGSLRLDSLASILEGGDQGPALVPGQPEKSLIVKAISHLDNDLKMPPKEKLPREQIADLTHWIKMGAPWPGSAKPTPATARKGEKPITDEERAHWSFQPVKRPRLPAVKNAAWLRNPIDAFILARLEAKGLAPNPPASPQELVRRVYYDLTGLPPTFQEVEQFERDVASAKGQAAWEKLIDRLLESPRYGEKWGRHWLDLVRYAETNSYERDNPKPHVWRYRDYVIRAFNQDKPYDQFIKEQLAGDELAAFGEPGASATGVSSEALIATGFYRLGIWDDEPSDPVQARYDGLDDIVATTGQVFLGLTFDCARCHDHKIDPILQKDYYRLVSFFHNINHYRNGGPTDEQPIGSALQRVAFAQAARAIQERRGKLQAQIAAIENEFRVLSKAQAGGGDLDDLRYRFYRSAWTKLPDFNQIKHEDEGQLPKNLFDLSPRTRDEAIGFVFEGNLIVPRTGKYTFYLDSDDGSRLSLDGRAVLEYDGIHGLGKVQQATLDLTEGRYATKLEYFQNVFGYGLYVAWSGPDFSKRLLSAPTENAPSPDIIKLMRKDGARVLGQEKYDEWERLTFALNESRKADAMPKIDMALCVTEPGPGAPETFVLLRGNPHVKGDKVEPAFPTIFNLREPKLPLPAPGAKTSGRRRVLADWIASPDNALTARVFVNRLWQHHFGRGIVRSPNDFGMQGSRPTHPELLDWLASEFVASGWSMKAMHRLILASNAYQMSSRANAEALKIDPANDLFWRFDMRRLSGEEIRDSILAVSGNLNFKMFGPSVYPEIPREVLEGQSMPGRGWPKSSPEEAGRRSVYIHVKRSLLYPILESFDLAEPDRSTPVRFTTTQPTQALGMLNGQFLNKQAAIFAERLRKEAGEDVARQVRLALALATSRQPTSDEVERGVRLTEALQREEGVSSEVALRTLCLVILNLNEFVYLD